MTDKPISPAEAGRLFGAFARYPRIALAVSGGPDSMALMYLAARWRASRKDGPALSVLTVDHGLRAEARAEAEMVARAAASLRLPYTILIWEHAAPVGAGVQAKARVARYDLMTAHASAHDIPAIATAHHLDDQAETFLMRLKRGSGLDGLAAIPESGTWGGTTLLRPLLDLPKARLVATVKAAGVSFAADPSNLDARFERARLRDAAEALEMLGLSAEALGLAARRLRRARAALDSAAAEFLAAHASMSEGQAAIDCAALLAAPEEIALRALASLIAQIGGGREAVQLAKLEALLAAIRAAPDKTYTLGHCRIRPLRGRLVLNREARRRTAAAKICADSGQVEGSMA
jgi:tRNA(Ile)-lysidine synthase